MIWNTESFILNRGPKRASEMSHREKLKIVGGVITFLREDFRTAIRRETAFTLREFSSYLKDIRERVILNVSESQVNRLAVESYNILRHSNLNSGFSGVDALLHRGLTYGLFSSPLRRKMRTTLENFQKLENLKILHREILGEDVGDALRWLDEIGRPRRYTRMEDYIHPELQDILMTMLSRPETKVFRVKVDGVSTYLFEFPIKDVVLVDDETGEDVEFGDFSIRFLPSVGLFSDSRQIARLFNYRIFGGVEEEAGNYFHPHIDTTGVLCEGEATGMLNDALRAGDIISARDIINHTLRIYNPNSPHQKLGYWLGNYDERECTDCGYMMSEDEEYFCEDCGEVVCNQCIEHLSAPEIELCRHCTGGEVICCDYCSETDVLAESRRCEICDNVYCRYCREDFIRTCAECGEAACDTCREVTTNEIESWVGGYLRQLDPSGELGLDNEDVINMSSELDDYILRGEYCRECADDQIRLRVEELVKQERQNRLPIVVSGS